MTLSKNGAADRGATHPRAYPVSLQQAAAAIFGISPPANQPATHPYQPSIQSDNSTGKIREK